MKTQQSWLNHSRLGKYGGILGIMVTDALVLKRLAISIHSDCIGFTPKYYIHNEKHKHIRFNFENKT